SAGRHRRERGRARRQVADEDVVDPSRDRTLGARRYPWNGGRCGFEGVPRQIAGAAGEGQQVAIRAEEDLIGPAAGELAVGRGGDQRRRARRQVADEDIVSGVRRGDVARDSRGRREVRWGGRYGGGGEDRGGKARGDRGGRGPWWGRGVDRVAREIGGG